MKVVDIRVDHFFAIVINVEKAYRDECKVLESVNEFLNAYLSRNNELLASDRELMQWLIQNCQRSFNDLSRTFSAKNTLFVQRINDLLEKKLELLYINLPEEQMLQQVSHLKLTADKLFADLREWAGQVIPLRSFKIIFGKNRFASEQLYRDWQKKLDQVKAQLCQIRYYLVLSFESLRKALAMDWNQSSSTRDTSGEHRDAFADEDWANFLGKCQPLQNETAKPAEDLTKSFTNQETDQAKVAEQAKSTNEALNNNMNEPNTPKQANEQADAPRFDLLKAFARLKEENDLLNQTYLRQNDAIQKMRKLFETKMRELVDQNNALSQQQQAAAQKRLDELTNENSRLKQKISSFETKEKEVVVPGITQEEIERDWKGLLNDLSPTEPTETDIYRDLCDELNNKNREISDLNRQIANLKNQNSRLKSAWFKSSQLICSEVVKLLDGFKSFSDQVKQGVGAIGSADSKLENQKLSANYLKTFMIIRRSVELLKRIYLQNLLGQVQ